MKEGSSDKVDQYIQNARPFAVPILEKIREIMHSTSPLLEESMKWSCPHFEYKGIVAQMAAFNQHVRFTFWKGSLLDVAGRNFEPVGKKSGMGAIKLASLEDFPPDALMRTLILEAIDLNERGVKSPTSPRPKKADFIVPQWFLDALSENQEAFTTFNRFSPSNRREYVEWVVDAKREATRISRLKQAVEWMADGKPRNWKYIKKWQ